MKDIIPEILVSYVFVLPIICLILAIIVYRKVGKIHKQNTEILQLLKSKE